MAEESKPEKAGYITPDRLWKSSEEEAETSPSQEFPQMKM
jgi:hypothetical protein